ncbi:MarR family winged helix-turn-helix transcriptional regulator [Cryobacterium sp.]|jgi:DNA-binding MarR family transcriptional regulator|uniref:MarR family winged helix-turn-helix transcriptional regulator n=1 Tax=Cryobacterium sp. TaxID=1926290 RepID=UPI0026167974|nr:MarR family transcriptional regulator [Cryobacterium sp.]MCU1447311.1 MarR family transcriptional regulator [Cryobacterium sp.]
MTNPATTTEPNLLALENQVCFALTVAARTTVALYKPILEPLGLTHPQYLVMLALWEQNPRTLRSLADALRLEPATLSPLLKRLEATGHIRRERSTTDERALQVTLTEHGQQLRAIAETIPARVARTLEMSPESLIVLRDTLNEVIRASNPAP